MKKAIKRSDKDKRTVRLEKEWRAAQKKADALGKKFLRAVNPRDADREAVEEYFQQTVQDLELNDVLSAGEQASFILDEREEGGVVEMLGRPDGDETEALR